MRFHRTSVVKRLSGLLLEIKLRHLTTDEIPIDAFATHQATRRTILDYVPWYSTTLAAMD